MQEIQQLDDIELIEKAKNGDEVAFTELSKRYRQTIYNFSYNVCHNKAYADEIVQDTLVNVFRKLHQFDGNSKFSTWLYSIVVNNCQMRNRQTKLEQASISIDELDLQGYDISAGADVAISPEQELISQELQAAFEKAIAALPVEYRLPLVLRDIEGLSAEEASEIMKITIPALKSRLHRARMYIRESMKSFQP